MQSSPGVATLSSPPPPGRYASGSIALHWLTAALVLGAWAVGLYMVQLSLSPQKLKLYSWHKWIGVTIFLLALARLALRHIRSAPPLPQTMPPWQRRAAWWSHLALYCLLLAIPVSGWLYSSASGVPVVYLGWLELPSPLARDKPLAAALKEAHVLLNWTLFVIVCIHVAAALKHAFIDRDGVLARMLPLAGKPGNPRQ
jgi:cytochrome b561